MATGQTPVLLLLLLAAAVFLAGAAGFVASFVYSYADGPSNSNNYSGVWVSGIAMLLAVQAACVVLRPSATSRRRRVVAWGWYSGWMASCGLIILVGLGIALPSQSGWAVLWIVGSAAIAAAAWRHRHVPAAATAPNLAAPITSPLPNHRAGDVEANITLEEGARLAGKDATPAPHANSATQQHPGAKPPCCSKASWRRCCSGFGSCMAWSSLFWGAVLGIFLVIQAANLAYDKNAFPPPGRLVQVDVTTNSGNTVPVKLHIFCTGPTTPGLATFILEGGGGSPGVTMAGIADNLAAGSRRACWYDRLGYGWSDDSFKPGVKSTEALHKLLAAVPDMAPPPYILAGHSAGGQLALNYTATYPSDIAGLALMDSYSDVAISLFMQRGSGATLATRQLQAPNGTTVTLPDAAKFYRGTAPLTDLLRAVTPLTWGRWITAAGKTGKYGPVTAAQYGNNKEWHVQWVELLAMGSGKTLADDLTLKSGRIVWQGAGWPDFSPLPVLLLPAAATLKLPDVCKTASDFTTSQQCVDALRQPQAACAAAHGSSGGDFNRCMADATYADLYVAYKQSLSSNTTLVVLPGGHGAITDIPEQPAQQLLAKFAGV